VLNDYYGGISMEPRPDVERRSRMHTGSDGDDNDYHLTAPSPDNNDYYWGRAAQPEHKGSGSLVTRICLIVPRHGNRYRSRSFSYTTGPKVRGRHGDSAPPEWDDAQLGRELKRRYGSLKASEVGPMQKIFAYKTIAYINVLQSRCLKDRTEYGHWEIVDQCPITSETDAKGRDTFMYRLRYPREGQKTWTQTIDNFIVKGAVIDLEVVETFDSTKIYWGVMLAVLLSLATALAYGFAMGNDFATGFSIASWMLAAFAFFAAVVAAGEYFGLEKPTSFQGEADLEKGPVPDGWTDRRWYTTV